MVRRMLAVVLASGLVAGCGGHARAVEPAVTAKTPPAPSPTAGRAGRLVAIGAGRTLYLECVGSGIPTVVLEAGLGAESHSWQDVEPQLGRTTRTCAYDRAGLGNSVAPPGRRDARDELDDLRRLLDRAHLPPPYVVVGHSYGGLLARLFAHAHPAEVAGVVLDDAMGRDQTRRQLAIWPKSQAPALRREAAMPVREGIDLAAGEALAARVTSLGDTPLAVVTAGAHKPLSPEMSPRLVRGIERLWTTMQDELAALSPDHVHVVALHSDHSVQSRIDGQPAVVVRAVRAVVRAAREHAPLPPCRRLFSGPGVRCRP